MKSDLSRRAESPAAALARVLGVVARIDRTEAVSLREACGRVLAADACADRDSPACDVSAMDGYALRRDDLTGGALPVTGEACIGEAPVALPAGQAMRIFTGGPVPIGADTVVKREDTEEAPDRVTIRIAPQRGANIRRRGENSRAGMRIVLAGTLLTPATIAALATVGITHPTVLQRIRVAIVTTGNEVRPIDAAPQPWEVRNANGAYLESFVASISFAVLAHQQHVRDDPAAVELALRQAVDNADVVLLSGGVSMGDHDHIPEVLDKLGATTLVHRVPMRPGGPLLAALSPPPRRTLFFGLPGNPVSTAITARYFVAPALAALAGADCSNTTIILDAPLPPAPAPPAPPPHTHTPPHRFLPVRLLDAHRGSIAPFASSGDILGAADSDGFIHVPPPAHGSSAGEPTSYAFFWWTPAFTTARVRASPPPAAT